MHLNENEDDETNIQLIVDKYESMLKTDKILFFDAEEFMILIDYYFNDGRLSITKNVIQLAVDQHPNSDEIQLKIAQIYIFEKNYPKAIHIIKNCIQNQPQSIIAHIVLYELYFESGDYESTILTLKKLENLTDKKDLVYYQLGWCYMFMDDSQAAMTYFLKYAEENNYDVKSLIKIAEVSLLLGNYDDTKKYLERVIAIDPYHYKAWAELGKTYFAEKNYEKALEAYNYSLLSNDTQFYVHISKGKTLEKLQRYNEAIETYNYSVNEIEPDPYLYSLMAHCYVKLGNRAEAELYFKKTIEEDPQLDKGFYALAKFYYKDEKYHLALENIQKAIELSSDTVKFWTLLTKIYLEMGTIDASAEVQSSINEIPNPINLDPNTLLPLHIDDEDYSKALKFLRRIEAMCQRKKIEDPLIYAQICACLFMTNQIDEAKIYMEKFMNKDPELKQFIKKMFPEIWSHPEFQMLIEKYS